MGEFGLWCVGIVVALVALSPSDTGKCAGSAGNTVESLSDLKILFQGDTYGAHIT